MIEDIPEVRALARQVADLQRQMRTLARAAQGPRRSVDVGEGGTTYYSEDGTPLLQVGVGEDGEFGLINIDPSIPPTPEAPDVEPAIQAIRIAWDGTFVDDNWTTSMSHVEVHVSDTPDFEATDATQVTTFTSQMGGEFMFATPNDPDPKYVALVAVSLSGVESEKSIEASGAGLIVNAEVAAALDELTAQVNNNTEEINNNQLDFENLAVTTQILVDQTASLDGRVSTSDYAPGSEDVTGRIDGSIWFARTRARVNWCSNPSFENNTDDWTHNAGVLDRLVTVDTVDGGAVGRMTNDASVGNHSAEFQEAAACVAGQSWTASAYVRADAGTLANHYAELIWSDNIGVIGTSAGVPTDVVDTGWATRLRVTATAPVGATSVKMRFVSPVASAVWYIDAALLELSPILGSYFDGSSYDCVWGDANFPNNSISTMAGGKIIQFYELDDNAFFEKKFSGAVLVDIDASTITTGYMDGERIQDNSIPHDKLSGVPVTAGEALAAGDLVNIYNVGGVAFARKADADNGRPCHGFVFNAVANGGLAIVHSSGYIPGLAGLTIGAQYLSVTPGQPSPYPAGTANTISQRIGFAVSDTVMLYDPSVPTYIV